MSRYIDADEILKKKWDVPFNGKYIQVVDVGDIEDMPTADVKEVVRGKWVFEDGYITCNKCKCQPYRNSRFIDFDNLFYFCPECGTMMNERNMND